MSRNDVSLSEKSSSSAPDEGLDITTCSTQPDGTHDAEPASERIGEPLEKGVVPHYNLLAPAPDLLSGSLPEHMNSNDEDSSRFRLDYEFLNRTQENAEDDAIEDNDAETQSKRNHSSRADKPRSSSKEEFEHDTSESDDCILVTSQADVHRSYYDETNDDLLPPKNVGDETYVVSGDDSANENVKDPEVAEEEIEESLENNEGKKRQDRQRKMTDKNVLTDHPRRLHIRSMLERIVQVQEKIDTLLRESQQARIREIEMAQPIEPNRQFLDKEDGEENVPENMQLIPDIMETTCPSKEAEKSIAAMSQEAGLLDTPTTARQGSEGSETPLGSLDITKVSLGDPEKTTDLKRFLREEWGSEGTMMKVVNMIRTPEREPITVVRLINEGPLISGHKAMIAARCFHSILNLKQHGFITVKKNPKTLEIADIELGPTLKKYNC